MLRDNCPICGAPTIKSNDDYACSVPSCKFSIGDKAFIELLSKALEKEVKKFRNEL